MRNFKGKQAQVLNHHIEQWGDCRTDDTSLEVRHVSRGTWVVQVVNRVKYPNAYDLFHSWSTGSSYYYCFVDGLLYDQSDAPDFWDDHDVTSPLTRGVKMGEIYQYP